MLNVLISGSTNTGFAPTYDTANAVAIYVFEGTITSSPSLIPNAFNDKNNASNPLPTPTQYLESQYCEKAFSNVLSSSPSIYQDR